MTPAAVLIAAALAAAHVSPTTAPTATGRRARTPAVPRASLPTVEGQVADVDHRAHRLRLLTAGGDVVLSFDRNTVVLGAGGAATPLQITPGARVRAGRDGEARAAWVELQPASSTPKAAP